MRKGGDGWEIEEDEDENGGRGGGDLFVDFVRGANASPEISAALPRRLVSRGPSPIAIGIPSDERRRRGGLIALASPSSHNGRFSFHFGPQKGSVKERPECTG